MAAADSETVFVSTANQVGHIELCSLPGPPARTRERLLPGISQMATLLAPLAQAGAGARRCRRCRQVSKLKLEYPEHLPEPFDVGSPAAFPAELGCTPSGVVAAHEHQAGTTIQTVLHAPGVGAEGCRLGSIDDRGRGWVSVLGEDAEVVRTWSLPPGDGLREPGWNGLALSPSDQGRSSVPVAGCARARGARVKVSHDPSQTARIWTVAAAP